jgi:hypothetical protein
MPRRPAKAVAGLLVEDKKMILAQKTAQNCARSLSLDHSNFINNCEETE